MAQNMSCALIKALAIAPSKCITFKLLARAAWLCVNLLKDVLQLCN
ncbi:hypothetical protein ACVWZV_007041 [Bradyrhizobium sp. GM5.1]